MPLLVIGLLPILVQLCLVNSKVVNIAKNKPVTYGSIEDIVQKSWANDGIESDTMCFKSKDHDRYWEVDLRIPIFIENLEIKSNNDPKELNLVFFEKDMHEIRKSIKGKKDCLNNCIIPVNEEILKIKIEKTGLTALHLCEVKALTRLNKVQDSTGVMTTAAGGTTKKRANTINMTMLTPYLMVSIMVLIAKCI